MPPTKPERRRVDFAALAGVFRAAAEPTRARVLLMLGDGDRHVGALCAEVGLSMAAISHHLRLLRLTGLVDFRRDDKRKVYTLTDAGRAIRGAVETLGSQSRRSQ
jgi:DNA-binding transcriptional ArsR family regulator